MARNFLDSLILPYQGASADVPVQQCRPRIQEPKVVRIQINWADYWPVTHPLNLGILVNLMGGSPESAKLDRIMSVKIDNVGSTVPIYLSFADTLDIVTAPPNSAVIMPTLTNGYLFNVYARGLTTGFLPLTTIYVANFMMVANVDPEIQVVFPQYLGSPTIQRTNTLTPGFGPPALGDQAVNALFSGTQFALPQTLVVLPLSATPTNFYYLTNININVNELLVNINTGNSAAQFDFRFYDQTTTADIFKWRSFILAPNAGQNARAVNNPSILQASNLNFRLSAGHNYALQLTNVVAEVGAFNNWGFDVSCFIAYTENPN